MVIKNRDKDNLTLVNAHSKISISNPGAAEDAVVAFSMETGDHERKCKYCGATTYPSDMSNHLIKYHAIMAGNKIIGWEK